MPDVPPEAASTPSHRRRPSAHNHLILGNLHSRRLRTRIRRRRSRRGQALSPRGGCLPRRVGSHPLLLFFPEAKGHDAGSPAHGACRCEQSEPSAAPAPHSRHGGKDKAHRDRRARTLRLPPPVGELLGAFARGGHLETRSQPVGELRCGRLDCRTVQDNRRRPCRGLANLWFETGQSALLQGCKEVGQILSCFRRRKGAASWRCARECVEVGINVPTGITRCQIRGWPRLEWMPLGLLFFFDVYGGVLERLCQPLCHILLRWQLRFCGQLNLSLRAAQVVSDSSSIRSIDATAESSC